MLPTFGAALQTIIWGYILQPVQLSTTPPFILSLVDEALKSQSSVVYSANVINYRLRDGYPLDDLPFLRSYCRSITRSLIPRFPEKAPFHYSGNNGQGYQDRHFDERTKRCGNALLAGGTVNPYTNC